MGLFYFDSIHAFARYNVGDWESFAINAKLMLSLAQQIDRQEVRYNSAAKLNHRCRYDSYTDPDKILIWLLDESMEVVNYILWLFAKQLNNLSRYWKQT